MDDLQHDASQTAILELLRSGTDPKSNVTLLFRRTRSRAIDAHRAKCRRTAAYLARRCPIKCVLSPDTEAIYAERADRVRTAVAELTEPYRTVVSLYFWEQMRVPEIAAELGRSLPAVYSQFRRAMIQLSNHPAIQPLKDEQ